MISMLRTNLITGFVDVNLSLKYYFDFKFNFSKDRMK